MAKSNVYTFTVRDNFFPQTFSGEIESPSITEAKQSILEDYAYELDTDESSLIVTIQLKEEN